MTNPKPPFEKLPHWPRWLNQQQAAVYLGVSPATFRTEIKHGVWPGPGRRLNLWDRKALDAASDRLSDLSTAATIEDVRQSKDPGYIKRRLEAAYGDEPDSPSQRTSGRRRGRKV